MNIFDMELVIFFCMAATIITLLDMWFHPGEVEMDTMKCPVCKQPINREKHEDKFICKCGWKSR